MNFWSHSTSFTVGYMLVTGHLASILERVILLSNGNVMPYYLQSYTFREEQGRVKSSSLP